ncbi:putative polyketide biosynthesis zinc-dependent hydrolase BaeB [Bremerella volcania]|uniref:Putative polyketide biosynthesis zinc-dependent hydrolase BaeB n=1 Tax=Bremerella volcania TaxID=2527984 RepID=A0A518CC16_9BACT|nr:MBL fold metallo-hydrolase [Bremerella volcania]QDU76765.1 putative polyketide biosynthesis zinc-dependent hydrolase BaeB [Bremerella volcania]
MLLKYFYDKSLAHASYMVGCQRGGVAVIVDPGRDIQKYLDAAQREGVKIIAIAETHIHADYVSGARELADRIDAKLYVSDEGPQEWKYEYAHQYSHQLLHEGDHFMIGNIRFDVLHTPGHTPESISFLVTDQGGGAQEPMGIFTGDFVFVNAIGRPDLLEQAAGIMNTAKAGASDLFHSIEKFKKLPEYLQVWPAHGAGSACGKGLGAIPSSTVGYELRFNPGLQFNEEEAFVDYILADQPEVPPYFAVMKRVNKEGPKVIGENAGIEKLPVEKLSSAIEQGTVVDLIAAKTFAQAHAAGTINIPVGSLSTWGGWLIDYDRPAFLVGTAAQMKEAMLVLLSIGAEDIGGYFERDELAKENLLTESYESVNASELSELLDNHSVTLVDVRSDQEWNAGHIPQARHHFLGKLPKTLDGIPQDQKVVVNCRSGARSAIGVSVLQAAGRKNVVNLDGGFTGWTGKGYSVVHPEAVASK